MPQVQAKPSFLATEKHNGVGVLLEHPGTTRSSRIPREYHDFVLGQHSCGSHGASDQCVELQWASHTSLFPPAGHGLGSAKVSRAQTFPSYPSEQGEEHQQSLSLASSYTFSYSSGLVQWQPGTAGQERQSSLEPAARAREQRVPSAPTTCHENWSLPAPAWPPHRWEPGEAASLKQRLSLYLFCRSFC